MANHTQCIYNVKLSTGLILWRPPKSQLAPMEGANWVVGTYHMQGNFDVKNLTNLYLPRFDELKVDETLDFKGASTFLEEYLHLCLHLAMFSFIEALN